MTDTEVIELLSQNGIQTLYAAAYSPLSILNSYKILNNIRVQNQKTPCPRCIIDANVGQTSFNQGQPSAAPSPENRLSEAHERAETRSTVTTTADQLGHGLVQSPRWSEEAVKAFTMVPGVGAPLSAAFWVGLWPDRKQKIKNKINYFLPGPNPPSIV
jgi:hypothetical protein